MKKNKKKQNTGALAHDGRDKKREKGIRSSLWFNVLLVVGAALVCSVILTPMSEVLDAASYDMSVDVEQKGGAAHIAAQIGAQAFFYLSSFLMSAAFFLGASYIARFASRRRYGDMAASSGILVLGMSVSYVLMIIAWVIVRFHSADARFPSDAPLLINEAIALGSAAVVTCASVILSRMKAQPITYAVVMSLGMFLVSMGVEVWDNINFIIKGIVLPEDIEKMIIALCLYVLHTVLGFFIMWLFLRERAENNGKTGENDEEKKNDGKKK